MEQNQFGAGRPGLTGIPADGIPITRVDAAGAAGAGAGAADVEPSLGELLKRLTTDAGDLVREEVNLARAELKQAGSTLASDGAKIGVAVGLALLGALALTAFLVIGLGNLLGGNYWLSALIVGVVLLAVGGLLVRSAVNDVKQRGIMPQRTLATLREDVAWAKQESREVKRELTK